MILPWASWIGGRLSLFLVCVVLVLGLVTAAITSRSFGRAADSARQLSSAELETLGHTMLLRTTALEAAILQTALEDAARVSHDLARLLARNMQAPHMDAGATELVQDPSGRWYDPDPERATALRAGGGSAPSPITSRDVSASAVLEDLLPVLFPQIRDAIGMHFATPAGLRVSYPRRDLHEARLSMSDVTAHPGYTIGAPDSNPLRRTLWTPPYLGGAGSGLLISVATPIYAHGAFRGVMDVDISLARIASRLDRIAPLPESFAFLIDRDGYLVTGSIGAAERFGYAINPDLGVRASGPRFDGVQSATFLGTPEVATVRGESEQFVLAFAPLPANGWSLAIGAPLHAVNAAAQRVEAGIYRDSENAIKRSMMASAVTALLAVVLLMAVIQRLVTRPIVALSSSTERLGSGDLDATSPIRLHGEFRVLGDAIDALSVALARKREEIAAQQSVLERRIIERTNELGSLFAISADLGTAVDAPSRMRRTLERLHGTIGFADGGVWVLERETLRRAAWVGRQTSPRTLHTSTLASLMRKLSTRQVIHVSASELRPHLWPLLGEDATSATLVALVNHEKVLGVLVLTDPEIVEVHQIDLIATVAKQLGTMLDNTNLLLKARESSALEERQHLARELHDSVSQALFGVLLGLQTAQREIHEPGRLRDAIEYAYELADAGLQEMRALIFELRPEALEVEGLVGLLRRQVEMLRDRHALEVQPDLTEPDLSLDAKTAVYRIAQEALHNVVKHSGATRVTLTLDRTQGAVRLVVDDDGRGFAEDAPPVDCFGLTSMRERAALHGGSLDVESAAGSGTRITVLLPIVTG